MPYLQSIRSSITIDRTILEGSRFLARGPCRPGVYVGFETCKCVGGEVKARDAHISSSMRRVYYHSRGCTFTVGVTGGWVNSHWVLFSMLIEELYVMDFWVLLRRRFTEILQIIEGILMLDKSGNLVHLRRLLKLINFRGATKLN
ncbi:hypothetical protein Gohar_025763 [Gossypium harknessii]|uniref:Uncharacterized protein n=1 Tax=Gossypium harknessii TaxID=34285 RepID=A0A7J9IA05_9ROSI|nr:hypothetical protein [Gossypium harknessii]